MMNLLTFVINVPFLIMVLIIFNRAFDKGLDSRFCLRLAWFSLLIACTQLLLAILNQDDAMYLLSLAWMVLAIFNFYGAKSTKQSK